MRPSAIPQVDSATDVFGDHPGRVVKVHAGGVGDRGDAPSQIPPGDAVSVSCW
jgi:hypothetical protein